MLTNCQHYFVKYLKFCHLDAIISQWHILCILKGRKEKNDMNLNNFTIKSQETLQQAITLARSNGNQALEPVHILKALMS